jgi:hypothetical protein
MHRSGGETREHGRQGCSGEGKNCYRRHPSACAEAAGGRGCGSAVKRSAVAASGSSENTASRPRKNNKVVVAAVQHKTKGAVHEDHGQARTIEVFASDINKFLGLVFTNTKAVYGEDKAVNIAKHFKEQEKLLSTFFENKNNSLQEIHVALTKNVEILNGNYKRPLVSYTPCIRSFSLAAPTRTLR